MNEPVISVMLCQPFRKRCASYFAGGSHFSMTISEHGIKNDVSEKNRLHGPPTVNHFKTKGKEQS
jgi:hypothetical protein